ncbi:hypothetical protein FUAX_08290 [Fulvitalea axinellae]|uniref:DUF2520 domain-containing protein n=1 Tax=Fulvitalea axinellae TaxID=1182444 RepID=A0AAU9CKF6_9BACT|nr:hypothetical protein FUAX_08290 [Fulvitalea axinellae]
MRNRHLNIGLVGTGNVAWHLAPAFEDAGHRVVAVYGRTPKRTKEMASRLYDAEILDAPDFSGSGADIVLLAVSDDYIGEVSENVAVDNGCLLVHCSGNVNVKALWTGHTSEIGVFYPLQTFSKNKSVDFETVPFCIESSSEASAKMLVGLAESLGSEQVSEMDSNQRASLHASAVFACNFTNHLLVMSKKICEKNGVGFEMLHPLLAETINKAMEIGPENSQTGPAKRRDFQTLEKHMDLLKDMSEAQGIYKTLTESILDLYGERV